MEIKYVIFLMCNVLIIQHILCNEIKWKQESIIIIGAGSSGIAAATRLYENGYENLKILEYEDRIGGRVNTIEFGDNVIDLGAQYCMGMDNVVYDLAAPHGYLEPLDYKINQIIESNGNVIPNYITNQQIDFFFELESGSEIAEYKGTLEEFFVSKYTPFADALNITEKLRNEFLNLFELFICGEGSMDNWRQENGINYGAFEDSSGPRIINWKSNGFKTILEVLMKRHTNPSFANAISNRIEFNKEVININYNNSHDYKIIVTTSDGQMYEADKVIVSIPLGVLKKKYETLFEPKLPKSKEFAIETIQFGVIDKIFLEFDTKWWPNDWPGSLILWRTEELEELKKSNSWLSSLIGFEVMEHQSKTLMAWICGPKTKHYETFSDESVEQDALNLLQKIFGSTYNISNIIRFKRTAWHSKPNFNGSYSYRGIDAYKFNVTNNDLAVPLKNQNDENVIFFAGEATNNIHFASVHGAIESGWRAAQEIISTNKKL